MVFLLRALKAIGTAAGAAALVFAVVIVASNGTVSLDGWPTTIAIIAALVGAWGSWRYENPEADEAS